MARIISMLSNTLNTNEVKNAAGTEQEFTRLGTLGRRTEFALIGESPSLQHRLTIQHVESGSGLKKRRRSNVRVDKTTISGVDSVTPITTTFSVVLDYPIGASSSSAVAADVIANGLSFLASLGASTTILYDGTGNGAKALIEGSL